jgi:hypothetical protein
MERSQFREASVSEGKGDILMRPRDSVAVPGWEIWGFGPRAGSALGI